MTDATKTPNAMDVIALRLQHLDGRGLTLNQKAQEIIADLLVHGFKIVSAR